MNKLPPIDDCLICNAPLDPRNLDHVLDHLVDAGLARRQVRKRVKERKQE